MTESSSESELQDIKQEEEENVKISQEDLDRVEAIKLNRNKKKRVYFGMKRCEIFKFKPVPISQKSTLFNYSEYISELINLDYTRIEQIIEIPRDILQQYGNNGRLQFYIESMKHFLIEIGLFVVYLSSECNNINCGKMRATDKFRYRCSAHRQPRDCTAIQYSIHTLDLFTERLNDNVYNVTNPNYPKIIPQNKAKKDMNDLCRRIYRIFAHSFFHHQQLFENYESEYMLCTRFIMFFRKYQLIPNALFKREIQIPQIALYFNRTQRKDKLNKYKAKRRQFEKAQSNHLKKAKSQVLLDGF